MNNEFEKSDLETIDYYFVACSECGKATRDQGNWPEAISNAVEQGYQIDDGVVYCKDCAELALQRQREDEQASEEARHDAWSRQQTEV